ncbi:hypothetical protein [Rubinisphaera margarita]|uniref:hypothetical protein n=1 Tax=Rubinisphaera margarita TaxID=2909586 RepID=UPI001EE8E71E|nr:hypothetical protein [Rubinisphaera margarita]MCG6158177.1 hypothetical protein [Rubinisphaera margarita]
MNEVLVRIVFLVHVASTFYMTGLIWFVQIVHYPLMGTVGNSVFSTYEHRHMTLTTWVVVPPMLLELAAAFLLFWYRPNGMPLSLVWAGIFLLGVIWFSTFFLQVPCHERLATGFDAEVHRRLISTNWIRTFAWSLRGMLVLWVMWTWGK